MPCAHASGSSGLGIETGLMGHLARIQTLPLPYLVCSH